MDKTPQTFRELVDGIQAGKDTMGALDRLRHRIAGCLPTHRELTAMARILDLWYDSERRDWKDHGRPDSHIFNDLYHVKEFVDRHVEAVND